MNLSIFRDSYPRTEDYGDVYCMCDRKYRDKTNRRILSADFLSLFIEKNSNGTRNLRLKGNELQYRINRRIENVDMELITKFVHNYPTLVKIDLSYNRINNEGIQTLCESYLSHENPLQYLNLTGCDIECGGIHSICKCWKTLQLRILKLTGNKFGSECGDDIYTLLTKNTTLQQLDIGATGQTVASFPHYMAAIRLDGGMNTTLKIIDLSDIIPLSKYYQPQPTLLGEHLCTMFSENNTLIELHIQKCALDGHAIERMIIGLKRNKSLLLLDLGYNKISNFGAEKLADYFMTSPPLMGLNIAGNSIGEIGARALSFGLPYSKLRLLDLSQNQINDQGLCEILLSIKKYQRMRLFYIFGNEIGVLSKEVLERQFMAGVYEQSNIDFQLYRTTEGLQVAKYPTNNYKQFTYNQLAPEDVRELRIRYNQLPGPYCVEHGKINFDNYHVDNGPCVDDPLYEPAQPDPEKLRQKCLERERHARLHEESAISSQFDFVPDTSSSDSCAPRLLTNRPILRYDSGLMKITSTKSLAAKSSIQSASVKSKSYMYTHQSVINRVSKVNIDDVPPLETTAAAQLISEDITNT